MTKTSQAGRRRTSSGFTLVELLVVLAIIALISALAVPTLSRGFGGGLEADAEALGNLLRQTRAAAIRDNRETTVTIDAGGAVFDGTRLRIAFDDDVSVALVIARREAGDRAGQIRFLPDGRSTGGRITLGRDGRSEDVIVDWFDGSVSHD